MSDRRSSSMHLQFQHSMQVSVKLCGGFLIICCEVRCSWFWKFYSIITISYWVFVSRSLCSFLTVCAVWRGRERPWRQCCWHIWRANGVTVTNCTNRRCWLLVAVCLARSGSKEQAILEDIFFSYFPQHVQENTGEVPWIMPRLFPSTLFPINYSPAILSFNAI
jgi:hypothetical protein